ncbi:hypothetical protein PRZ48_005353 [Zasmidium cellare]|uniref:BHLH domain-containing protein n=1 Tax=Zasmidium cellare TaxID=395010 RepID=A0ABR0ES64_ZASCE|nr:hypothetical protein PRZ48_005353 [Zasmidium cellare]
MDDPFEFDSCSSGTPDLIAFDAEDPRNDLFEQYALDLLKPATQPTCGIDDDVNFVAPWQLMNKAQYPRDDGNFSSSSSSYECSAQISPKNAAAKGRTSLETVGSDPMDKRDKPIRRRVSKKPRQTPKTIEKRYRSKLGAQIEHLKRIIPTLSSDDPNENSNGQHHAKVLEHLEPASKTNKATVLAKTIEYIKFLENQRYPRSRREMFEQARCNKVVLLEGLDALQTACARFRASVNTVLPDFEGNGGGEALTQIVEHEAWT